MCLQNVNIKHQSFMSIIRAVVYCTPTMGQIPFFECFMQVIFFIPHDSAQMVITSALELKELKFARVRHT